MNRLPQLISSVEVRNLTNLIAVIWLSLIALLSLFVRPSVILAVGARGWSLTLLPLFTLLFLVLISLMKMVRGNAQLFAATDSHQTGNLHRGTDRQCAASPDGDVI
jgi:hypothetical protein